MTSDAKGDAGQPQPETEWTIRRIIGWTTEHLAKSGSESARLDSEVLLGHAMGLQRIQLYVNYGRVLTEAERSRMREFVKRRATGEPVAYLVGFREFFSLPMKVNRNVLVPRPETETLVVEAISALKQYLGSSPRMLDLCTGSGCVAVAVAKNQSEIHVTATDLSEEALIVARENATTHLVADRVEFYRGDLWEPIPAGTVFQVIASNPPYVSTGEIADLPKDVRDHEPCAALDGGADGLDLVRKIVNEAPRYLCPGGRLLIEVSPEQVPLVETIIQGDARYAGSGFFKDFAGLPRVVWADAGR